MCDHPRNPTNVFPDGSCRACDAIRQARYRTRRSIGLALLRVLESRGIGVSDLDRRADEVADVLAAQGWVS